MIIIDVLLARHSPVQKLTSNKELGRKWYAYKVVIIVCQLGLLGEGSGCERALWLSPRGLHCALIQLLPNMVQDFLDSKWGSKTTCFPMDNSWLRVPILIIVFTVLMYENWSVPKG